MSSFVEIPCGTEMYVLAPGKVIALGLNYRDHIQESVSVKAGGHDPVEPREPVLFPKLPTCVIGNGEAIRIPRILRDYALTEERTDYEGELAIIIGRDGVDIAPEDALGYVKGYTCANDVSQRNIQNGDRSGWFRGKSFDTFLPMGPRIVPAAEIDDPGKLSVVTRLNGRVVQEGNTAQMIFPVERIIAYISRNFTLRAGDVILTGTPSGVGPLAHGDVVEVEIEGIGILKNPVVDPRRE